MLHLSIKRSFSKVLFCLRGRGTKFQLQNEYYPNDSIALLKNKFSRQRYVSPVTNGIKTFSGDQKLSYMDSSIDLSQTDVKRV